MNDEEMDLWLLIAYFWNTVSKMASWHPPTVFTNFGTVTGRDASL